MNPQKHQRADYDPLLCVTARGLEGICLGSLPFHFTTKEDEGTGSLNNFFQHSTLGFGASHHSTSKPDPNLLCLLDKTLPENRNGMDPQPCLAAGEKTHPNKQTNIQTRVKREKQPQHHSKHHSRELLSSIYCAVEIERSSKT